MKKGITAEDIISQEVEALRSIPKENNYDRAVSIVVQAVHKKNGKILTTGVGKAGNIAGKIAVTLSSTGTPSQFLHPLEAVHGDLGVLKKNDVLLILSNSGETREIIELVPLAKKIAPELKIIAITGKEKSTLARLADVVLSTGGAKEVCPLGLTPTTSTTTMAVLGDVLAILLMQKIGFTKKEYALRHHGGYLGKKARGK